MKRLQREVTVPCYIIDNFCIVIFLFFIESANSLC